MKTTRVPTNVLMKVVEDWQEPWFLRDSRRGWLKEILHIRWNPRLLFDLLSWSGGNCCCWCPDSRRRCISVSQVHECPQRGGGHQQRLKTVWCWWWQDIICVLCHTYRDYQQHFSALLFSSSSSMDRMLAELAATATCVRLSLKGHAPNNANFNPGEL